MDQNFEVIEGTQPKSLIYIYNEHTFKVTTCDKGTKYLCCTKYYLGNEDYCKASGHIKGSTFTLTNEHNHESLSFDIKKRKALNRMKALVSQRGLSIKDIYNQVIQNQDDEVRAHMTFKMVESTLYKHRRKEFPVSPKSALEAMEAMVKASVFGTHQGLMKITGKLSVGQLIQI